MRRPAVSVVLVLAAAACTGDDGAVIETAAVVAAEVVQTVAAPAELEPAGRVTVTAPVGGDVAEVLVGDGDVVAAGDPLVRLDSDSVDLQVAQAQAAVDAADALAAAAAGGGMDLAPLLAAFRGQLDAVFPPLLDTLDDQLTMVVAAAEDSDLVDVDADAVAAARDQLEQAEAAYRDASDQLRAAERQTGQQAQQATAGQVAAAEAQREQAELALEAARARIDDLAIVAPAGGVVELARAGDGDPGAAVPDLDALAGGADDLPDLGGLLGGGGPATGSVAEGTTVGPGQPLLTIYDLSAFTARAQVDELDIVEVEEGQAVTVLVDAFPGTEITGVVSFVALTPERAAAGGTTFPVTVELTDVPDEVRLRIGLTASAEIEVRRVQGDTVVPTSALLRRGTGEVVHAVRDGVAVEVPVTVVAIGDETAAVDGALRTGEQVVTTGVELVEDGDEVPG